MSFQALVAPLLIDSYDLEGKVFEQGIPEQMLEGVGELDLVGIGVLPGPMRKLLGVSKPFVAPSGLRRGGGRLSGLGRRRRIPRTLGAAPRPSAQRGRARRARRLRATAQLHRGKLLRRDAKYVTANVNLWPRPLVIVIDNEVFASLTPEQQSALRDAVSAALPEALAASRAEDEEAAPILCRRGMTFAAASESDLAELRTALEPVYADLTNDPDTKYIAAITDLKTEIAASAEAPAAPNRGREEPRPRAQFRRARTRPR